MQNAEYQVINSSFSVSEETPLIKPKRQQVKNACTNCQKACKKCDDGRPCQRCIKYGLSDTCVNSQRKERKKANRKSSANASSTSKSPQSIEGSRKKSRIKRKSNIVSDSEEEYLTDWYLEDEEEMYEKDLSRKQHLQIKNLSHKNDLTLRLRRNDSTLTPISRTVSPKKNGLSILSELCAAEIKAQGAEDETDDDGDIVNVVRTLFSPPETPNDSEKDLPTTLTKQNLPRTPFPSPVLMPAPMPIAISNNAISALSLFAEAYYSNKEEVPSTLS